MRLKEKKNSKIIAEELEIYRYISGTFFELINIT